MTTVVDGEVVQETTDETTPDNNPAPTLAELSSRFGSIQAFETEFKKWVNEQRADLYKQMLAAREATGGAMKSVQGKYGDGLEVTYSLKGSSEKFAVDDEDKLIEWVEEHFPSEIKTTTHVRPAFLTQLLEKMLDGVDGEAFVKDTTAAQQAKVVGEQVPGVKHTPANDDPTGFNTSWKGGNKAKAAALAALASAPVGELLGGDNE